MGMDIGKVLLVGGAGYLVYRAMAAPSPGGTSTPTSTTVPATTTPAATTTPGPGPVPTTPGPAPATAPDTAVQALVQSIQAGGDSASQVLVAAAYGDTNAVAAADQAGVRMGPDQWMFYRAMSEAGPYSPEEADRIKSYVGYEEMLASRFRQGVEVMGLSGVTCAAGWGMGCVCDGRQGLAGVGPRSRQLAFWGQWA